jgi:hypothetical protein
VLRACFAASAAFAMVLAFGPPLTTTAIPALIGIAGSLGLASGVVQAVIGVTAPPERAGTIAGTIGAIGALAGLLPPLLLAVVYGVDGSYGIGLTVLAALALASAAYLHRHRRWIGAVLAFPATSRHRRTRTTVVSLPAAGSVGHTPSTIARLIALAAQQEMIIVSVVPDRAASDYDGYPLVTGLRRHLPRHHLITIVVGSSPLPHEVALVDELINNGALPVVLTTTTNPMPPALHLAHALHADHLLNIADDRIDDILIQEAPAPAEHPAAATLPQP